MRGGALSGGARKECELHVFREGDVIPTALSPRRPRWIRTGHAFRKKKIGNVNFTFPTFHFADFSWLFAKKQKVGNISYNLWLSLGIRLSGVGAARGQ